MDQPRVLEFTSSPLREHGAEPTCNLVHVPVDLRHDWPAGSCPDAVRRRAASAKLTLSP
ncbi:class I SAM-dependent methyltransferase [Mycobacterium helveticum]|uniref:Class I SAM-dependent methyltransferase n=1 Tax=Mycobacterium helveticum TaxID=2592811 RepID=A0A557XKM7_9MYCO|nr:class I SAM-dependent methyltransferase [Mycobacterium helveticum]TVS86327.1 class I SAM-dependent methyltransferase [Mycobacterium helveticum]